jgi:hypothetical protein
MSHSTSQSSLFSGDLARTFAQWDPTPIVSHYDIRTGRNSAKAVGLRPIALSNNQLIAHDPEGNPWLLDVDTHVSRKLDLPGICPPGVIKRLSDGRILCWADGLQRPYDGKVVPDQQSSSSDSRTIIACSIEKASDGIIMIDGLGPRAVVGR